MVHPRGRIIGIDVGSVRIGVAVCDPDGILATPVATVERTVKSGRYSSAGDEVAIAKLTDLVVYYEAVTVIVGMPRDLRGKESFAANSVRKFADKFANAITPVPLEFVDERMTTVVASRALRSVGRDSRAARSLLDQAAAAQILQGWLDSVR